MEDVATKPSEFDAAAIAVFFDLTMGAVGLALDCPTEIFALGSPSICIRETNGELKMIDDEEAKDKDETNQLNPIP